MNDHLAKSDRYVVLEHNNRADQFQTFRAYVKDYKDQEHVTGHFNIDTTSDCMSSKYAPASSCRAVMTSWRA